MSGRWSLRHHLGLESARDLSISELLTSTSNMEGRRSPSAPHHACVACETGRSIICPVLEVAISRLRPHTDTILSALIKQLSLISRIAGPLEVLQVQVPHVSTTLVPQVMARALVLVGIEEATCNSLSA